MKKTIVIGSGFGGLAIACRLKAMGHDVTVLEKLDNLGGRARTLYHNGFEYDAGPTVITAPYLLNEIFDLFGKDSRDYFNLLRVKPYYRFVFSDKSFFDYGSSLKGMLNQIKKNYSKEDAIGYIRLLKHSKRIFDTAYLKLADYPFENIQSIRSKLITLKHVGLGYMKIGQQATTLSGGEAQRIKLAKELSKRPTGRTLYILDEPTTGLHSHDIKKLLEILQAFANTGNTVVVIEHNLDVIKTADHIIDMGPEGGVNGGKIIAEGSPEKVSTVKESYTGKFIKEIIGTGSMKKTA